MKKVEWSKQASTQLDACWDGTSSWCLLMGPECKGIRVCDLSSYPPEETHPRKGMRFDLKVPEENLARVVLETLAKHCETCLDAMAALSRMNGKGLVEDLSLIG